MQMLTNPVKTMAETEQTGTDYQTCPRCALPHKLTDTKCSYCGAALSGKVTFAEKIRRAIETAKWRYKLKTKKKSTLNIAKGAANRSFSLIIGSTLALFGVLMLYSALKSQAFMDFLIAALLMGYGGYAVFSAIRK